jgi:hypothetical protein
MVELVQQNGEASFVGKDETIRRNVLPFAFVFATFDTFSSSGMLSANMNATMRWVKGDGDRSSAECQEQGIKHEHRENLNRQDIGLQSNIQYDQFHKTEM